MEVQKQKYSRKKFVVWGVGILASLSVLKFGLSTKKKKDTVKMLSQDGTLVEVDMSALKSNKGKASNKELQTWVKR